MAKKTDDGSCPLCGEHMDVRCVRYRHDAFIDGKKYESICFACFSVPKLWDDEGNGNYFDHLHLKSIEELMDEGWNAKEAKRSLDCVKRSIKKNIHKLELPKDA